MTPEVAHNAMQFMMRVQLSGQEVPAFNAVMVALQKFADTQALSSSGEQTSKLGHKKAG